MPLVPVLVTKFTHKTPTEPPPTAISHTTALASLACGTVASDECRSSPSNPAGHSVPRVCVFGRKDSGVSW